MATKYCARCLTTFVGNEEQANCPNLSCGSKRPEAGWGVVLEPGDLLDRHYKILKALAVGGAGITYLAREVDARGEPVPPDLAIKLLYTQRASGPFLRRLSNEAQILQELAHEHIVQSRGFVHRAGHEPYLVTLFEHGGSLGEHIEHVGPVSPRVAAGIVRQILLALDVAHQRGVIHRDLKPDNVLLREKLPADEVPHVRLTDFGIAKVSGGVATKLTRMGAFVGTPEYAAPEQFEGLQPTSATDIFAAGGVLWYCVTGRAPVEFSHRTDIEESYDELLAQLPPRVDTAGLTGDAKTLTQLQTVLNGLMHPKPEERWSIHQILAQLGELEGRTTPLRTIDTANPARPRSAFDEPTLDPSGRTTLSPRPTAMPTYTAGTGTLVPTGSAAPESQAAPPRPPPPPPPPAPPLPAAAAQQPPPPAPVSPPAPVTPLDGPRPTPSWEPGARKTAALAPRKTDGHAVGRAGVLGLGVASMGVALVGGGVLVTVLLVFAAWALGWFGGPPPIVTLEPINFG